MGKVGGGNDRIQSFNVRAELCRGRGEGGGGVGKCACMFYSDGGGIERKEIK